MPYQTEHAARIRDPGLFIPDSFRSDSIKEGVRIIIGKLKSGGDSMVTQAYRFSSDKFTIEEAKQWLKDNDVSFIKFEPAQEGSEEELKHVGILGMRWGVRRNRTSGNSSKGRSGKKTIKESKDYKEASKLKKKRMREMSNEEIQKVSRRIRLEKEYRSLNPTKINKGKNAVGNAFNTLGKIVAVAGTLSTAYTMGKKVYEYASKNK